ncbi:HNH endonuclease [Actinoallomurus iriomotensis]|uniref:HNH nuclease domain-containing protein n=1 Tax=Actinoallomurus iriomotensis TaxID=478107 RepID=A0A9W6VV99_9ACTN|nr:HNH endonuclease signature motif containing protein [Actinoallomurus iriomotensis]GLY86468.1 hypothetical protein Airi02_043970 [Actinoallomurus iriomotensis]
MTTNRPETSRRYPPEAYAPNGELWWYLKFHPGTKRQYGDERKIAAWLTFHVDEGTTFTMRTLRQALGEGTVPNDKEQLNRRLRKLRQRDGWIIPSNTDDRTLPVGTYRLEKKGWHPGLGEREKEEGISNGKRRRVIERDGRRCVVCGVGSGEPYVGEPDSKAVMTVGHRIPRDRGGSLELDNLQTECKRCNETVRHELGNPESLVELRPDVKKLRTLDLKILLSWLNEGKRIRSQVDAVYDRTRKLSHAERATLTEEVRQMLEGRKKS